MMKSEQYPEANENFVFGCFFRLTAEHLNL